MAHREIGQEEIFAAAQGAGRLDGLDAGIDWVRIAALLSRIYAGRKGEKAWPPLALFKALLLGTWHDLSDVRLAEALEDRASFRRFCGFSRTEATPERTAFVRFRAELAKRRGLSERLFDEVTLQLARQGLMVRSGTLVDATVIPAAPGPEDAEAGWNVHTKAGTVKGYKAHISTDRGSALVRKVHVTTANELDAWSIGAVLGHRPGAVYADKGYDWGEVHRVIRARGGRPMVMRRTNKRSRPDRTAAIEAWNATIKPIRGAIEKVFGTAKRSYGLARARWRGLAKAALQIHLTFTVYTLRRAKNIRAARTT